MHIRTSRVSGRVAVASFAVWLAAAGPGGTEDTAASDRPPGEPESEAQYRRAVALLKARKFEDGLGALEPFLVSDPRSGKGWYARGVALQALKRYPEALAAYGEAARLGSAGAATALARLQRRVAGEAASPRAEPRAPEPASNSAAREAAPPPAATPAAAGSPRAPGPPSRKEGPRAKEPLPSDVAAAEKPGGEPRLRLDVSIVRDELLEGAVRKVGARPEYSGLPGRLEALTAAGPGPRALDGLTDLEAQMVLDLLVEHARGRGSAAFAIPGVKPAGEETDYVGDGSLGGVSSGTMKDEDGGQTVTFTGGYTRKDGRIRGSMGRGRGSWWIEDLGSSWKGFRGSLRIEGQEAGVLVSTHLPRDELIFELRQVSEGLLWNGAQTGISMKPWARGRMARRLRTARTTSCYREATGRSTRWGGKWPGWCRATP